MKPFISSPSSGSHALLRSRFLRASLVGLGLLGPILVGGQAKAVEMINAGASVTVIDGAQSISCTINVFNSPNNCADFVTPGTNKVFGVLGDKKLSFVDFIIDNPGNTAVTLLYNWVDPDQGLTTFDNDEWEFVVEANPFALGPLTVSYTYDVEIVDGGYYSCPVGTPCFRPGFPGNQAEWNANPVGTSEPWFFKDITLETNVPGTFDPAVIATKLTTPPGAASLLTSTNGGPGPQTYTFLNNYKTIRVTDTIVIPASPARITSITNSWTQTSEVPGPLPILGVGAAFGMSRNLRRRIKARATV